jgi:hypothetical protein
MEDIKKFSLVKPTLDTPFHIDFGWWENQGRNWKVFLRDHLCPEHQAAFSETQEDAMIDWVDPATAEVTVVDGIQQALISHCSKEPGFFSGKAVVDSIFLVFLTNTNKPMTPKELEILTGYPAQRILLTIGGITVQKGIRPFQS